MGSCTLILNYGRCGWGSCLFCGYGRSSGRKPDVDALKREFDDFFGKMGEDAEEVKVFSSGSFLDDRQIPAEARRHFIGKCMEKDIRRVTIESRPEYVTKEKLEEFEGVKVTLAIGLESADNQVLERINKGFRREDYERAADIVKKSGGDVRTYLLVNPPYVKDVCKSVDDSVEYALKHSDSIVLINLLPHSNAPLFKKWVAGEWSFLDRRGFDEATARWADNPKIELDYETFKFTPQFPDHMKTPINGVGEEYLTHPYFEAWQDYLDRFYQPSERKKTLLLLPCSYRKPYSESKTHKEIIGVIGEIGGRDRIHEVMLSNAGVIPREFEDRYPFNAYDWDESLETPEIRKRYVQVTSERIANYLRAHGKRYDRKACYLRRASDSHQAVEKAFKELGMEFDNLLSPETDGKLDGGTSGLRKPEALDDLREGLRRLLQNSTR
ncbi:MAG: DUF5591 domain-containing protein [Candidatus Altiarchaeota archaeon]